MEIKREFKLLNNHGLKDLTGERFGSLVALKYVRTATNSKHVYWLCKCDCGKETYVKPNSLIKGRTRGCGCGVGRKTQVKHGHAKCPQRKFSSTYNAWNNIKIILRNPKHPSYNKLKAKNITMDPRWEEFSNFLADMGERPEHTSLRRRDKNLNYNAENCIWTPIVPHKKILSGLIDISEIKTAQSNTPKRKRGRPRKTTEDKQSLVEQQTTDKPWYKRLFGF